MLIITVPPVPAIVVAVHIAATLDAQRLGHRRVDALVFLPPTTRRRVVRIDTAIADNPELRENAESPCVSLNWLLHSGWP